MQKLAKSAAKRAMNSRWSEQTADWLDVQNGLVKIRGDKLW